MCREGSGAVEDERKENCVDWRGLKGARREGKSWVGPGRGGRGCDVPRSWDCVCDCDCEASRARVRVVGAIWAGRHAFMPGLPI